MITPQVENGDGPTHEALVRRLMAAFTAQDGAEIAAVLAPECVWRVPGDNGLSGDYQGLPAVMRLFRTLKRLSTGPAIFDIVDIATSGQRAMVYQYGHLAVGGETITMKECLVYRFEHGLIVEVDEFQYDQAAFDRAFSRAVVAAVSSQ